MKYRASGVLMHITSLPSPFGIGDLGPWAHRFADFLAQARQSYWQILPLNPTCPTSGNSPYDSYSAFAGNPLLISPELLLQDGLLRPDELREPPSFSKERVEYQAVTSYKARLTDIAFQRYQARVSSDREFERFCHENDEWLDDYCLFVALRAYFRGAAWRDWPTDLRYRDERALSQWKMQYREQIKKEQFIQYLFFKQWASLRRYCNSKNILLLGDVPIYVSYDSADVWANPRIFKLDDERRASVVAGVPPDYFSPTGQLWGNPVYRWDVLKATGYAWWLKRLRHNLGCFDRVRLDHFRGFVACWEVPAGESAATSGKWVRAASDDFFATLLEQFGPRILVEDLGLITPDVRAVRERFGFAGMKVLLFAFGQDLPAHPYAPHNHEKNSVVYTGTHDTNTVRGWFLSEASPQERERLSIYIGRQVSVEEAHWELIRLALMSVADTAMIPMQDLSGLGAEARMNRPATTEGNWQWRLIPEQMTPSVITKLARMTELYGRASAPVVVEPG